MEPSHLSIRIFQSSVVLLSFLLAGSPALAASTENYCIQGSADGLPWSWEVRFFSSLGIEIDRCVGTATATMGASPSAIRDIQISEINAECGIVVTATPYSGVDCGFVDPGFTVDGFFASELWLEENVASPPGPLLEVTPTTPVNFTNAYCYVDVPEPSSVLMLSVGILGLVGLTRIRQHR